MRLSYSIFLMLFYLYSCHYMLLFTLPSFSWIAGGLPNGFKLFKVEAFWRNSPKSCQSNTTIVMHDLHSYNFFFKYFLFSHDTASRSPFNLKNLYPWLGMNEIKAYNLSIWNLLLIPIFHEKANWEMRWCLQAQLDKIMSTNGLSENVFEIASKSLAA